MSTSLQSKDDRLEMMKVAGKAVNKDQRAQDVMQCATDEKNRKDEDDDE